MHEPEKADSTPEDSAEQSRDHDGPDCGGQEEMMVGVWQARQTHDPPANV
jgi:hypothetical protein